MEKALLSSTVSAILAADTSGETILALSPLAKQLLLGEGDRHHKSVFSPSAKRHSSKSGSRSKKCSSTKGNRVGSALFFDPLPTSEVLCRSDDLLYAAGASFLHNRDECIDAGKYVSPEKWSRSRRDGNVEEERKNGRWRLPLATASKSDMSSGKYSAEQQHSKYYWTRCGKYVQITVLCEHEDRVYYNLVDNTKVYIHDRERERLFRQTYIGLEETLDGLWEWTYEHNFMYLSPRYLRKLGFSSREELDANGGYEAFLHIEDREQVWSRSGRGGKKRKK